MLGSMGKKISTEIVSKMGPQKAGFPSFVQKLGSKGYDGEKSSGVSESAVDKSGSSEADPGLSTASEAIMSAFKSGDTKDLSLALKSFVSLCQSCMDEDEGDGVQIELDGKE